MNAIFEEAKKQNSKKEGVMKELFSGDTVKQIGGKLSKSGIAGVDIKELMVYIASYFNSESGKIEKAVRATDEKIKTSIDEAKKLRWILWAILIPLWGVFVTALFKK